MSFKIKKIKTQTFDQSTTFNPKTGEIIQVIIVFKAEQTTGRKGSFGIDYFASKLGIDGKTFQKTKIDKRDAFIYSNPKYFPKNKKKDEDKTKIFEEKLLKRKIPSMVFFEAVDSPKTKSQIRSFLKKSKKDINKAIKDLKKMELIKIGKKNKYRVNWKGFHKLLIDSSSEMFKESMRYKYLVEYKNFEDKGLKEYNRYYNFLINSKLMRKIIKIYLRKLVVDNVRPLKYYPKVTIFSAIEGFEEAIFKLYPDLKISYDDKELNKLVKVLGIWYRQTKGMKSFEVSAAQDAFDSMLTFKSY
jgi:hypothetical protein